MSTFRNAGRAARAAGSLLLSQGTANRGMCQCVGPVSSALWPDVIHGFKFKKGPTYSIHFAYAVGGLEGVPCFLVWCFLGLTGAGNMYSQY